MSVTGSDIVQPSRGGEVTAEGATADREILIFTSDRDDGEGDIRSWLASNYPIGAVHPDDSALKLKTISYKLQGDSEIIWVATLKYGTPTGSSGGDPDPDPLNRPAEYRWMGQADLKEYSADINDKILANSALEPFDIPPQRYEGAWAVEVVRNVAPGDHGDFGAIHCTINDDDVVIDGSTFAEGQCLAVYRDGPKMVENGTTFYQVTLEILIKPTGETWDDSILDAGYNERDLITFDLTPIVDVNGTEVRKPYPLNGLGQKAPDPNIPSHIPFEPYVRADWGDVFP